MSFLIDSNTLIYAAKPDGHSLRLWLNANRNNCYISEISELESMRWPQLKEAEQESERETLVGLIESFTLLKLDDRTTRLSHLIAIRAGIKKADSEIAATALLYGLTLVTANTKDFKKASLLRAFPNLKVFIPFRLWEKI